MMNVLNHIFSDNHENKNEKTKNALENLLCVSMNNLLRNCLMISGSKIGPGRYV